MENLFFFSGSITAFFIFLLLSKRNKGLYDWFLIAWFSVILYHITVFHITANDPYSYHLEISSAAVFLNGPILWFYTRAIFYKRISSKLLFHLIPFTVNILIIAPYIFQNMLAPFSETFRTFLAWAKLGSILYYSILSIWTIHSNLKRAEDNLSNIDSHTVEWLRMALKTVLVLWLIGMMSQLLLQVNFLGLDSSNEDFLINAAVSIMVIYMGFYGFKQVPGFFGSSISYSDQQAGNTQTTLSEKYQNSPLDDKIISHYALLLENLMSKEKIYKNPDLSLIKLASELDLTTNQLSQIINQFYLKNFYEYVNSYRIEEVKQRLANGEDQNITLLGIAIDAGFNSKATFNRFFKKQTGKTPSEYIKELKS
jgi:AraC-like DNA-binding protein